MEHYPPVQRDSLRRAIISGEVDPVHVAEGYEIAKDKDYGVSVGANVRYHMGEHDIWQGSVSMAHALGVQFIPAKNTAWETGYDF